MVGPAYVAHQAAGHEIVERSERLLPRGHEDRRVKLVEVDPLGPQPPQRLLGVADHMPVAQPEQVGIIAGRERAHLRCDHNPFPSVRRPTRHHTPIWRVRGIRFLDRETCNDAGAVIADVGGDARKCARRVARRRTGFRVGVDFCLARSTQR
jgi:hypothetical protein